MPSMPNSVKPAETVLTKTAIFICGPTAVGKTDVSITLAQDLQTEIISFDSRQFFKELQIGAAPPSREELDLAKHHLVGHLSVKEEYSAGDFERDALKILDKVFEKKDTAILVGGSGMYMKALAEGFDEMPEIPTEVRERLKHKLQNEGLESLSSQLKTADPTYHAQVDLHNPQRVIRALEIIETTGQPYSQFRKGEKAKRHFNILKIGITLPREELYERINLRVDKMIEAGLEEEVRSLLPFREKNSMQTVGYREYIRYFDGEWNKETAISEIKKNSRRYAKRQMTWFNRDKEIRWFEPKDLEEMKKYVLENMKYE